MVNISNGYMENYINKSTINGESTRVFENCCCLFNAWLGYIHEKTLL